VSSEDRVKQQRFTSMAAAQSVYPMKSASDAAWGRSTEYLKFAIEDFSRPWVPYRNLGPSPGS
jgi:hypothetical protein